MFEQELQQYLLREYPQENARCEWKEFKNLKNSFSGDEKDDVISYVSALANMEGGHMVIGVKDKTLEIVGTDLSRLTFNGQPTNTQSATFKLTEQCTYLPSEGLSIEEFITDDTHKTVWIIHIPKHLPRRPVLGPAVAQITWTRRDKNEDVVDYEIDAINKEVAVRIYGNAINKRYTQLLKTNESLSLQDCIMLDAVQKGRTIYEDVAHDLLKRGLIEGEAPNYTISLGLAKATHQLPTYTKNKGLDKTKLRQMILQYLQNAGDEGAKRDSIYEYLKDVLPQNKTEEQQLRMLGDLLNMMSKEFAIRAEGRIWYIR